MTPMAASEPRQSRAHQPQRLSALPDALKQAGFDCQNLKYRRIWLGAIERRYPALQINNVWHFRPGDAPTIGSALNLPRITQAA
jgi:hypothetical protein